MRRIQPPLFGNHQSALSMGEVHGDLGALNFSLREKRSAIGRRLPILPGERPAGQPLPYIDLVRWMDVLPLQVDRHHHPGTRQVGTQPLLFAQVRPALASATSWKLNEEKR